MNNCKFCKKECKNNNSQRNHERLCKCNPNRQYSHFSTDYNKSRTPTNQFIKANNLGLEKPVVSESTRKKLSDKLKNTKIHTEDFKAKMSRIAIERNLGGVRNSKKILYNNILLGSTYELQVAISLDNNKILWNTCNRFNYYDNNNKLRSYTPDFYLPEYDIYLDPKNDFLINNINPRLGFKDIDKIKWVMKQNNIKVFILNKDELNWNSIFSKISNS